MLEMRAPTLIGSFETLGCGASHGGGAKISSDGSWTCGARICRIDRIPLMVAALLIFVHNSVTCTVHLLYRHEGYVSVSVGLESSNRIPCQCAHERFAGDQENLMRLPIDHPCDLCGLINKLLQSSNA